MCVCVYIYLKYNICLSHIENFTQNCITNTVLAKIKACVPVTA